MARDTKYNEFKIKKSPGLKKLRHRLEYFIALGFIRFAGIWSVRINLRMGSLIGKLGYRLAKKERGIADYQLEFCFPELSKTERIAIVKDVFINTGKTVFETLCINKIRKQADHWIKFHNKQIIDEAQKEGKGAVLLVAHVANWELFTIVFEQLGIYGKAVQSPVGDEKLDNILQKNRQSVNLTMIPRQGKKSVKELLNCFRNNQILVTVIDQDTRAKSIFVDFFGKSAATPSGPASFGQKFNVPVISAYSYRDEKGVHHFDFQKQSEPPYQGGDEEMVELTQKYSLALEDHIRKHTAQWMWFHRRWRNQPDND
jgi:Kdo2-lipid IVA lauroyltransferase/acyltransferase